MLRACPPTETDQPCGIRAAAQGEYWPPVLRRSEAAKMCSISVQTFDAWVRKGILPPPMPGTRRWSRAAIERHLAGDGGALSPSEAPSPFEQWKQGNAH
jgi:predicted DNA-binding transcriptional regulator AlpA